MPTGHFKKLSLNFRRFLEHNNKHPNTIRSYTNDLKQFILWCKNSFGEDFKPAELSRSDIQDFRTFLLTRNSSPASVNRKITALRQFFEFCLEEKAVQINPVTDINSVTAEPRAPVFLPRKEALLLARTAEKVPSPLDPSILLLLLHSGLRSSEICFVTIGDLHLTPREGRLFIKGQRGKTTRFVYLTTRTQSALRSYCRWRGVSVLAKRRRKEYLFSTSDGAPLSQQAIDQIVKRIGKLAGVPHVTPSMLRSTFAAQSLAAGKTPENVARVMGVASLKSIHRLKEELAAQESGSAKETGG